MRLERKLDVTQVFVDYEKYFRVLFQGNGELLEDFKDGIVMIYVMF